MFQRDGSQTGQGDVLQEVVTALVPVQAGLEDSNVDTFPDGPGEVTLIFVKEVCSSGPHCACAA